MKPFKNYILPLLLLLVFTSGKAQFMFQKALGTDGVDVTRDLIITQDGNYLVMGYSWQGSTTGLYLTKIDTSGTILWEKWHLFVGTVAALDATWGSKTICENTNGELIVGSKTDTGDTDVGFLIKFDANGDTLFTKRDSITLGNNVSKVLQAPDGNLLALVDKSGATALVKMDNNFNWISSIDTISSFPVQGIEVLNNNIYILIRDSIENLLIINNDLTQVDTVNIPINFPSTLKISFDESHLIIDGTKTSYFLSLRKRFFTDLVGNINVVCDSINSVGGIEDLAAIDSSNHFIYLALYNNGQWGLDVQLYFTDECGTVLHDTILYRGSFSIQPLDEFGKKVLVDSQGNYIIYGRAMYGPLGGQSDIFLFKYKKWQDTTTSIDENNVDINNPTNAVLLYPNPFNNSFTISGITENSNITVLDVMGQVIHSNTTHNTQHTIPTTNWAKGLYIVQLKGNTATTSLKVVKQ
jgi:hypothetical protein